MTKKILTGISLAAMLSLNANAQQLPNGTFDADWVKCYPWEKGEKVTSDYGIQPEGWCVSNVPNGLMPKVSSEETGADGTGKAVKLSNVSVMGQTAPGYITLGTSWATAETKLTTVRNADGGVFGGIEFTYHPDALQLQYKHDICKGEESMSIIAYLWKGTWTQLDVPSNTATGVFSYGTAEKVTMIDRGNNILGKECLQGGEISKTDDAALIAVAEKYIAEAADEWTTATVELNYGEFAGQPVDVEKLNIVISVSNFFGDRESIVDGNSVCIDDVQLVYYHALSALSYEGQELNFDEATTSYDLSTEFYDASKLSYTVKGQAATVSSNYDEATALLTIRVEGEDIASNPESFTEYTIQFATQPEPEPLLGDMDGDGVITVNDINLLIKSYLESKGE